jgi:hypothetical protein
VLKGRSKKIIIFNKNNENNSTFTLYLNPSKGSIKFSRNSKQHKIFIYQQSFSFRSGFGFDKYRSVINLLITLSFSEV